MMRESLIAPSIPGLLCAIVLVNADMAAGNPSEDGVGSIWITESSMKASGTCFRVDIKDGYYVMTAAHNVNGPTKNPDEMVVRFKETPGGGFLGIPFTIAAIGDVSDPPKDPTRDWALLKLNIEAGLESLKKHRRRPLLRQLQVRDLGLDERSFFRLSFFDPQPDSDERALFLNSTVRSVDFEKGGVVLDSTAGEVDFKVSYLGKDESGRQAELEPNPYSWNDFQTVGGFEFDRNSETPAVRIEQVPATNKYGPFEENTSGAPLYYVHRSQSGLSRIVVGICIRSTDDERYGRVCLLANLPEKDSLERCNWFDVRQSISELTVEFGGEMRGQESSRIWESFGELRGGSESLYGAFFPSCLFPEMTERHRYRLYQMSLDIPPSRGDSGDAMFRWWIAQEVRGALMSSADCKDHALASSTAAGSLNLLSEAKLPRVVKDRAIRRTVEEFPEDVPQPSALGFARVRASDPTLTEDEKEDIARIAELERGVPADLAIKLDVSKEFVQKRPFPF